MKDAYYFSHDSNARNDPKIIAFCQKYGHVGYAYFFELIEFLREQKDYTLPADLKPCLNSLWGGYGQPYDTSLADRVLSDMVTLNLIQQNADGSIFSPSLITRMAKLVDKRQRLSDAGKKGASERWGGHRHPNATPIAVKESKVKESKVKEKAILSCKQDLVAPIEYLNQKTGKSFNPKNKAVRALITARFNEGRSLDDFKNVIDRKCSQWLTDAKMVNYLRPSTLFNLTNFENYLNEKEEKKYDFIRK